MAAADDDKGEEAAEVVVVAAARFLGVEGVEEVVVTLAR